MKRSKILILALTVAMLFIILGTVAFATGGEEIPTLKIEAANLSFDDSVYVLYAVSHNGIEAKDITMLFWSEPQADLNSYVKGTENYSKTPAVLTETVKSADCVIFENDELRAKNMADYVYARAYAVVDGVEYYSEVSKYSILQYAYNKLGYTGTESTDTALKNMLTSMLNYGADAQAYFEYNTARPANGEFYQVKVEGGTLEDGFSKGLYLATETATLTAPEKSGNLVFAGWKNSADEICSTDNTLTLTGFSANETYTATYEESATYSEGLAYRLSEDETYYIVTGIGTCTDTEVVIPSLYNGLPVKEIGDYAFSSCESLASVTIPDSITSIGDLAFHGCTSLTSVTIPGSVTSIGYDAFYNCTSLTSVTIPGSVTSIGDSAFCYCTRLTSITIPDSVTSIGFAAFYECKSLTSVTISDSVTSIGDYAFAYCTGLTSVTIPDSVTSIDVYAFENCTSLASITIPDSVTSIGDYAFENCTSLTSITVSEGNTAYKSIDGNLYSEDGKTLIQYAIGKTDTSFVIPDGVTSIGDYAFYNCTNLTSITIPDSVTSIGDWAFARCDILTSVIIPNSVTTIGYAVFRDCTNLTIYCEAASKPSGWDSDWNSSNRPVVWDAEFGITDEGILWASTADKLYIIGYSGKGIEVVIPSSINGKTVTNISSLAFYGCTSLTTITIPDSVTSIGDWAFARCDSLTSVIIPNSVTSIGENAFYRCTRLTSITIPDSVTTIGSSAFSYCISLTSVTIPDSVTSIGDAAFAGCTSITSVTIGNSIISIGYAAFAGCTSLTSITVSEENTAYKSIDGNLYSEDGKTLIQYAIGKTDTSFVISDGVTSIGEFAFENCTSLASITIPDSVTSIGYDAFYNCTSLTSVTIPGSVTIIGSYAFSYCGSLTIYCEAASQPSGWDSYWNYSNCPVVWGYKE